MDPNIGSTRTLHPKFLHKLSVCNKGVGILHGGLNPIDIKQPWHVDISRDALLLLSILARHAMLCCVSFVRKTRVSICSNMSRLGTHFTHLVWLESYNLKIYFLSEEMHMRITRFIQL